MPLSDYSKVKPVTMGNFISQGYTWGSEVVTGADGFYHASWRGLAVVNESPASEMTVWATSQRTLRDDGKYLPTPLVIPAGAIVEYAGLRLPFDYNESRAGSIYGEIPPGGELVGTTGEILKVSFDADGYRHAATSPTIECADNSYTANSYAIAARGAGNVDSAAPSLFTTLETDTEVKVYVSDAANAAAGNGISFEASNTKPDTIVLLIAEIGWRVERTPVTLESIGYPTKRSILGVPKQ